MTSPRPSGHAHSIVRGAGHLSGAVGAVVLVLFVWGLTVPPAEEFPDSLVGAFHTFFTGIVYRHDGLPSDHDAGWIDEAEPGDVIFVSRGRVPWGSWSHAAVVVIAPDDAIWAEPGSLAVLDASIHDGMYFTPLDTYAEWPRVVLRRASRQPEIRDRIAGAAIEHRKRLFAGAVRPGAPYTNCTASAVESLAAAGLETGLTGWRTPDELFRSGVWVD